MNITEFMSFDLEWFTTPEGLLITGGVIVLLIALIIFIISNKKSEKKNASEVAPSVDNSVSVTPDTNMQANTMPVNEPLVNMPVENNNVATMDFAQPMNNGYVAGAMNSMNPVNPAPVDNVANDNVFKATSFNNIIVPSVEEPVAQAPEMNTNINDINTVATNSPVVDFSTSAAPSVPVEAPVVETPVAPVPEVNVPLTPAAVPVAPVMPTVEPAVAPVAEEKPMIYGGVNPANTIATSQPAPRPVIYGGANPLENTTTLPRITSHEAYSASLNNVNVAPVETPVVPSAPVAPVAPVVTESVAVEQAPTPIVTPTMPMTGAEMFGTNDINDNNGSSSSSSEIETLEF